MNQTEVVIDLSQKYDPTRNQKQLRFHLSKATYKLYGGAIGGGKTAAIINEALQLLFEIPMNRGLLLRKTLPSFKRTVFPQLEKFVPFDFVASWNHSDKFIAFKNGSILDYGSLGDDPRDYEKFMSGEYGFIAIDQAEEFAEKDFEMLSTRLRLNLPNIRHYFILTCNPTTGWLKKRFIDSNLPDHEFIPALPSDNIRNLPLDYLERMKAILDPQTQRALLEGDWSAIGEPDSVFSYLQIQEAIGRSVDKFVPVKIGVDVARFGDDETTIYLKRGLRVELFASYIGHDLMKTSGEVIRAIRNLMRLPLDQRREIKTIEINIDADGVGGGVVDRLKEQEKDLEKELKVELEILEIHGGARADDPQKFKNKRAEIHFGLSELLDIISIPDDTELSAQLMSLKYKINSAGQVEIIPKEDIKRDLGKSPDRAEGLIYSCASVKKKRRAYFAQSEEDFY